MIIWLNNNEGFAISLLTFLYLLATVLIYSANSKNNRLQKKIQKQNVDIQLFNERNDVYNQIKNKINKPFYNIADIFNGNSNIDKSSFDEDILFKAKYLFFESAYNQLIIVNDLIRKTLSLLKIIEKYYERLKRNSETKDSFKKYLDLYYQTGQFTEIYNTEFKELTSAYIYEITVDSTIIKINFYDYFININKLMHEFSKEREILFNKIYSVMDTDCFKEIDLKKRK